MAYHLDPLTREPFFCTDRTGDCVVAPALQHFGSISEAVAHRIAVTEKQENLDLMRPLTRFN